MIKVIRMNEYNFTHEELIRLFDSASPQTQRMVFAILKIDHESNANNREYEQYLGKPRSYVNGVPLYETAEPASEIDSRLGEAVNIALKAGEVSVSMLQRRMNVGYARAGRLIDEMEQHGIVSQADSVKPRKVLISSEDTNTL